MSTPDLGLWASVLVVAGAVAVVWRSREGSRRAAVAGLVGLSGVGLYLGNETATARARVRAAVEAETPPEARAEDGFVTSDSCRACHPAQWQTWHDSYHRTMTQRASDESVVPSFDGVELDRGNQTYRLSQNDAGRWVTVKGQDFRVVMTTGSHYMQTFWVAGDAGNELLNLPFVYLLDEERWLPRDHVFLRPPNSPPMNQRWNVNCVGCHSTYGQMRIRRKERKFDTKVAELGIACEACHGPAEDHVAKYRNPFARYASLLGESDEHEIVNPERLSQARASEVCGQCHSKGWVVEEAWDETGLTYRPGERLSESKIVTLPHSESERPLLKRSVASDPTFLSQFFWPDGMVRSSGREYGGMVESECYRQSDMGCMTCHAVHGEDPNMQLRHPDDVDAPCRECHEEIAAQGAEHTQHEAGSPGSSCVNCHMPYTSYGLLRAMRSHWIDNPRVEVTAQHGRPNACNGCHLDQTLAWTQAQLSSRFGQTSELELDELDHELASATRLALQGDAVQRALSAWAFGWPPARQASGEAWIPAVASVLLEDPYSVVRFIAARSLRRLGYAEAYDFLASQGQRATHREQTDAAVMRALASSGTDRPAVLVNAGAVDLERRAKLLEARDDTPVELQE